MNIGFVLTAALCWAFSVLPCKGQSDALPSFVMEKSVGLLIPDFEQLNNLPSQNMAYLPNTNVRIYDRPEGKTVAILSRFCPVGKFSDGNMRMFILPLSSPNNCQHITTDHLYHLSDDTYVIPYVKKEGDFILLFHEHSGYWAKTEDFTLHHFNVVDWKGYFIAHQSMPCYGNKENVSLRKSPYADAEVVCSLSGENYQINFTGHDEGAREGNWCKVKVSIYKESPCKGNLSEKENTLKIHKGWIQITDENGYPLVHLNTKGC